MTVLSRRRRHARLPGRRPTGAAALATVLAVLAACGGGPEEPVAEVRVEASELTLPYPGTATLETVWRPAAPLPADAAAPVVFVHLRDGEGAVVRTFDHPFPGPWTEGEAVRDPVELWQSALAPPLSPGRYRLDLGLVEGGGERRWPLALAGPAVEPAPPGKDRREYRVATVVVPPAPDGGLPEVSFSGAWGPATDQGDRQVVVSRPLHGAGAVVLEGLRGPHTLGLLLHLAAEGEGGRRLLRAADGSGEPSATVSSPCAAEPARVAGPGDHAVRLRLEPPAEAGPCPVRIEPGFTVVDAETLERLPPVRLWRLTVEPAAPSAAAPAPGPA